MSLGGFLQMLQCHGEAPALNQLLEFGVGLRSEGGTESGSVGFQAVLSTRILISQERQNLVHRFAQLGKIDRRRMRNSSFVFLRFWGIYRFGG